MSPELFWVGSALLGAGAAVSKFADMNPFSHGFMRPALFDLLTNIAALAVFPVLISGFFFFSWKDPIIAFALGWVVVLPLEAIAKLGNRVLYQQATMLACLAGIICTVAMFFVGGDT